MIQYKHDVLDNKDFCFLQEYITDDPSVLYQRFPIYSFLPKDEPAENYIEKLLRKLTPGKEHIEYWFRWNDQSAWHVDGDEVVFKSKINDGSGFGYHREEKDYNAEDPTSSRIAITTHLLYLFIQNLLGGELQICTSHPWDGKYILNNKHEPPLGASITTIKPFQNMAVRFPSKFYHRVKPFKPKLEGFPMKRLVLVWAIWDHHPEGYKTHKHWKLNDKLQFIPASGWRDFTAFKKPSGGYISFGYPFYE